MELAVTREVIELLHGEASRAHPRECCGILLGEGSAITSAIPASNVHPSPQTHFEIDPQTLINAHRAARVGGPQVLGYYHSHPDGPSEPSATDRDQASRDGAVWAIVGRDAIGWWLDAPDGFTALPYVAIRD